MVSPPTIIFVGSPSRSGSTMLDLMLGNAEDAFSLGEVHAHYRPWWSHHYNSECQCGETGCPVRKTLIEALEHQIHQRVFETQNVQWVIDSSKEHTWLADVNSWGQKQGYRVLNLIIYKQPASLAHSFYKRGKSLHYWQEEYLTYYERFFELNLPFISINYDNLIAGLPGSLEKLCQALGMSYFPGKENFWEKEHHYFFGSGTVSRMLHGTGTKSIKRKGDYNADYLAKIPEVEAAAKANSRIRNISQKLIERDILLHPELEVIASTTAPKHPFWYYKLRLISWFLKTFKVTKKGGI